VSPKLRELEDAKARSCGDNCDDCSIVGAFVQKTNDVRFARIEVEPVDFDLEPAWRVALADLGATQSSTPTRISGTLLIRRRYPGSRYRARETVTMSYRVHTTISCGSDRDIENLNDDGDHATVLRLFGEFIAERASA
jgi:hypothetical protein